VRVDLQRLLDVFGPDAELVAVDPGGHAVVFVIVDSDQSPQISDGVVNAVPYHTIRRGEADYIGD